MQFSPEAYLKWLQHRAKQESEQEYNFFKKIVDVLKGNWHKGKKDAFHEAQMMCAGEGPCYVCHNDKLPWPDVVECVYASLIKEEFVIHLKEQHGIHYKNNEDIDKYHKFVMKDA